MLGKHSAKRQSIISPKYAPPDLDQQPTPVDPWRELAQPQRPKEFEREAAPHEGRIPSEQLKKSVIKFLNLYLAMITNLYRSLVNHLDQTRDPCDPSEVIRHPTEYPGVTVLPVKHPHHAN